MKILNLKTGFFYILEDLCSKLWDALYPCLENLINEGNIILLSVKGLTVFFTQFGSVTFSHLE